MSGKAGLFKSRQAEAMADSCRKGHLSFLRPTEGLEREAAVGKDAQGPLCEGQPSCPGPWGSALSVGLAGRGGPQRMARNCRALPSAGHASALGFRVSCSASSWEFLGKHTVRPGGELTVTSKRG